MFFENENQDFESFPEYGKQCTLIHPWRGYSSATIVRLSDHGFVVQVSSGAEIDVYPEEIEID